MNVEGVLVQGHDCNLRVVVVGGAEAILDVHGGRREDLDQGGVVVGQVGANVGHFENVNDCSWVYCIARSEIVMREGDEKDKVCWRDKIDGCRWMMEDYFRRGAANVISTSFPSQCYPYVGK